jgi:hypothetical protein
MQSTDQIRIISNIALKECSQGCTIVNGHHHIFEANDGYESLFIAVLEMKQHLLNYILRLWQIPPDSA